MPLRVRSSTAMMASQHETRWCDLQPSEPLTTTRHTGRTLVDLTRSPGCRRRMCAVVVACGGFDGRCGEGRTGLLAHLDDPAILEVPVAHVLEHVLGERRRDARVGVQAPVVVQAPARQDRGGGQPLAEQDICTRNERVALPAGRRGARQAAWLLQAPTPAAAAPVAGRSPATSPMHPAATV